MILLILLQVIVTEPRCNEESAVVFCVGRLLGLSSTKSRELHRMDENESSNDLTVKSDNWTCD